MTDDIQLIDRLVLQNAEFDACEELAKALNRLPPVVDDDYPEAGYNYERALYAFISACKANGRALNVP